MVTQAAEDLNVPLANLVGHHMESKLKHHDDAKKNQQFVQSMVDSLQTKTPPISTNKHKDMHLTRQSYQFFKNYLKQEGLSDTNYGLIKVIHKGHTTWVKEGEKEEWKA